MSYFYIEPEVAGGIGDDTVLDTSVHPPLVSNLSYEFDTFPSDAILSGFPAYIVTDALKDSILQKGATGVDFDRTDVTTSATFDELKAQFHPDQYLPSFAWMKVSGQAGRDDFGIGSDNRLVVSERLLALLQVHGLENALVEAFEV
jgi:hypothetical protein